MAINYTTNADFDGRHTAADSNYPYGSSKNETSAGSNDGMPHNKQRADDILGMQQALLVAAGITPTDSPDTAIASQYLDAMRTLFNNRTNKIVDGGFSRWDEGISQTSSGYGSDTMWFNQNIGTTKTHSRQEFTLGQTDVPGNPKYFSRTVVSSVAGAGNYCVKQQRIEKAETLSGGTATLSFWAKADSSKNIAIDLHQRFGSGGTPSSPISGIGAQKIAITSSWVRYAATVDIPSVIGKSLGTDGNDDLEVTFWFDAGSNFDSRADSLGQQSGTFDIYGVQIEEGTVATKFEDLPQSEIDAHVDYFYRNSYSVGYYPGDDTTAAIFAGMYYLKFDTSTSMSRANFPYSAGMRATPTITLYEPTGSSANSILVNGSSSSATGRWVSANSASVGWTNSGYDIQFHWESDARL